MIFKSKSLTKALPRFLIDTGSELNIIKAKLLKPNVMIQTNTLFRLAGIGKDLINTLGSAIINLGGVNCRLNIVPDDFPIEADGILGVEFLREQGATLSFKDRSLSFGHPRETTPFLSHDTFYLPARTKTLVQVTIQNPTRSTGYIPRINAGPGLLMGECLVANKNGKTHLFAINSTAEDINVIIPPLTLELYDSTRKPIRSIKVINNAEAENGLQHRINRIIELLNIADLDSIEQDSVRKLVTQFPCQFHLPGDMLSKTSMVAHKIPTTDNAPVNVKQYRYPPQLREVIQKQIQELIHNDIIEESESPYNSPLWIVPKKPDSQGNKRWRLVIDFRALNEKTIASLIHFRISPKFLINWVAVNTFLPST